MSVACNPKRRSKIEAIFDSINQKSPTRKILVSDDWAECDNIDGEDMETDKIAVVFDAPTARIHVERGLSGMVFPAQIPSKCYEVETELI